MNVFLICCLWKNNLFTEMIKNWKIRKKNIKL